VSPRAQLVCYKTNLVILERQSRTLVKLQTVMLINVLIIILHDPIFLKISSLSTGIDFMLKVCGSAVRQYADIQMLLVMLMADDY